MDDPVSKKRGCFSLRTSLIEHIVFEKRGCFFLPRTSLIEDTMFEKRVCFSQRTSRERTDGRVTRETFHRVCCMLHDIPVSYFK